jgi:hypothetical protein
MIRRFRASNQRGSPTLVALSIALVDMAFDETSRLTSTASDPAMLQDLTQAFAL